LGSVPSAEDLFGARQVGEQCAVVKINLVCSAALEKLDDSCSAIG
jgi:hypothetical protein